MLVIRRRAGESLLVGDDVEIEVLVLTQNHVKLGIRAPKTVSILRKEVRLTSEENVIASRLESLGSLSSLLETLREKAKTGSNKHPSSR